MFITVTLDNIDVKFKYQEVMKMMGYGNMMGWGAGWGWFGIIGSIFWIVLLIDLILLGLWLWRQLQKK